LTDEITGVDNTGLEMADEVARGEIDELENDGLKIDGPENDGRNKTDEKWRTGICRTGKLRRPTGK